MEERISRCAKTSVAFRSAKGRSFAERRTTIPATYSSATSKPLAKTRTQSAGRWLMPARRVRFEMRKMPLLRMEK